MSRTWGLVYALVGEVPTVVVADVIASVESLKLHEYQEDLCALYLLAYPTLVGCPLVLNRRLVLSLEKDPELDFPNKHMGTIELLGHKEVHLYLEDVRK